MKFIALGQPVTQGSMRAFAHAKTGKVITVHDKPKLLSAWRDSVAWAALDAMDGAEPWKIPLQLIASFYLRKPKSVRRMLPHVRPDLDKLVRAVSDALSGIVYSDDALIVECTARKLYGDPPRAEIEVLPVLRRSG